MKNLPQLIFALFIISAYSCKKDNINSTTTISPQYKEKNYKIMVVDENNQPIINAKISDGTNTANSNSTGSATFNTPKETYGKYRFEVKKDGYFTGSLNLFNFTNPDTSYKVMLLKAVETSTIPSTGGTVTDTGWTFNSSGGFKYENGTPVTGNVNISIRYIKPDDFEFYRKAFPGQDFTGLSGGNDNWLFIYGWVAINYSVNGVRVFPNTGSVSLKVQVPGKYANAAQNGGKVFAYDEAAKIWEESANPTVSGLDVTMVLPSQTSFCALGKMEPTATITYSKNVCMPNYVPNSYVPDYGYVVQVELDFARLDNYVKSIPGFSIYLRSSIGINLGLGANNYAAGCAVGNYPFITANFGSNDYGAYISIFENKGFESEKITFPTAYDGGIKIHSLRIPLKEENKNEPISDKIIKEYASFPSGVTSLGNLNKICDGSISNPHGSGGGGTEGTGQFTYNGQTINGSCSSIAATGLGCTGIDVLIIGAQNFIIYNMPNASSGTFNVNGNGDNCNLWAATLFGGVSQSTSGTITKTGAKSFSFTITMKNISTGSTNLVATGTGNYN